MDTGGHERAKFRLFPCLRGCVQFSEPIGLELASGSRREDRGQSDYPDLTLDPLALFAPDRRSRCVLVSDAPVGDGEHLGVARCSVG